MALRRALNIDTHMKETLYKEMFPGTPVPLYLNGTTVLCFLLYTSSLQFKKRLRKEFSSILLVFAKLWDVTCTDARSVDVSRGEQEDSVLPPA